MILKFSTIILCYIFIFLLSPVLLAQVQGGKTVDAKTWSPTAATKVKKQSIINHSKLLKSNGLAHEAEQVLDNRYQYETGVGLKPHSVGEIEHRTIEQENKLLSKLIQQAEIDSIISKSPLGGILDNILPKINNQNKSASIDMYIKTSTGENVTSGYAYLLDSVTSRYIEYAFIDEMGKISVEVELGREVHIFVTPFDNGLVMQPIENVVIEEGKEIKLLAGVAIDIDIYNQSNSMINSIEKNIFLEYVYLGYQFRQSYLTSEQNSSMRIFVLPDINYAVDILPEAPYLSVQLNEFSSNLSNPVNVSLESGVTITTIFTDPDSLIGLKGCFFSGTVSSYKSIDKLNRKSLTTSYVKSIYSNGNLSGFEFAVPENEYVDIENTFTAWSSSYCKIEDVLIPRKKYNSNENIELVLKKRPELLVDFKNYDGDQLEYKYGWIFDKKDKNTKRLYFSSSYPSQVSLVSGKTYGITLVSDSQIIPKVMTFVAQPGENNINITTDEYKTIDTKISFEESSDYQNLRVESGLIEFYQKDVLIVAFEYTGGIVKADLPVGTFDVRVSGVSANFYKDGNYHKVIMQPFWLNTQVLDENNEELNISFTVPEQGITINNTNNLTNRYLNIAVKEGAKTVIAISSVSAYQTKIYTDYSPLELQIRGEGLADKIFSMKTDETFPELDLTTETQAITTLSMTVTDKNNNPLSGLQIRSHSENGIGWANYVGITNSDGEVEIPKIKNNLLVIPAPIDGNIVSKYVEIENIDESETKTITMSEINFNNVTETEELQLLYGTGKNNFQVVFLAEAYTGVKESFTDSNNNGVWDGNLYIDINGNGLWDYADGLYEPYTSYGEFQINISDDNGTDISANNEAFVDLNNDGYPSIDDFAVFVQNSKDYIRSLVGVPLIAETVDFDAYILYTESNQAGTDVINTDDEKIIDFDTRFNSAYIIERSLLSISYSDATSYLDKHLPNRDLQIVMLNQPVRVGRANAFILAYGGIDASSPNSNVSGHEFGHNPGGLSDEYNEFNGTSQVVTFFKHHMNQNKNAASWKNIVENNSEHTTAPNSFGNGFFAGGFYNAGGVFRSTANSRMRNTAQLFNNISKEIMQENIAKKLCINALTPQTNPDTCFPTSVGRQIQPGFYYDKAYSGHGFVIEPIGNNDLYFVVFYTYKEDGTPEWYTSLSKLENGVLNLEIDNNTLLKYKYDYNVDPAENQPNTINNDHPTNLLTLDFNYQDYQDFSICNSSVTRNNSKVAVATWQLGTEHVSWCVEPLISESSYPNPDLGGTWYAGGDDSGWGLSLAFVQDTIVSILYFYDAQGNPRWVLGTAPGFNIGEDIVIPMKQYSGYPRTADSINTTSIDAGSLTINLSSISQNLQKDGTVSIDVSYQGQEGGSWERVNLPITNITAAH